MGQNMARERLRPSFKKKMGKVVVFDDEEMDQLYAKFLTDYPEGYMTEEQFLQAYEKFFLQKIKSKTKRKTIVKSRAITNMSRHLFRVADENGDQKIDFREFLCAYSFSKKCSAEKKLERAFKIFDINGDGKLSFSEMKSILRCCLALSNSYNSDTTDERFKKLFDGFDKNNDGFLSFDEFKNGSYKNPILISIINNSMDGKDNPKL